MEDQDTDIQEETVEDKIDDIYSSNDDGHESHDDIVREMEDTDSQPELLRDPDWTPDEECNGNGENFSDDDAADDEEKEEHQNKSSRNEVRYTFHIAT